MDDIKVTDAEIRRYQNLKLYKGKTPDEIRVMIKESRANRPLTNTKPTTEREYEIKFNLKLDQLKDEYGVDMNNSNDMESLKNLVRLFLQSENTDLDIRTIQGKTDKSKDDLLALDKLSTVQRNLHMSISDLQEKLGINRKARKEKSVDDFPQFVDGVLKKAQEFFDRKTIKMECPTCKIELVRAWLNFPELTTIFDVSSECPHCGQISKFTR